MDTNLSHEVYGHTLDEAIIEQIDTLRTIRINIAESMLQNLPVTSQQLISRGILLSETDTLDLRRELEERISVLKSRLFTPHIVYLDEIKLYMDLADAHELGEESALPQ